MNFNTLIPELYVSDFAKSLDFYTKILGFVVEYERKSPEFALLSYQGSQIMIQEKETTWATGTLEYPYGRGVNFQIETSEIEKIILALNENNHPIKLGPMENQYDVKWDKITAREILVMDPDGYLLRFSQTIK